MNFSPKPPRKRKSQSSQSQTRTKKPVNSPESSRIPLLSSPHHKQKQSSTSSKSTSMKTSMPIARHRRTVTTSQSRLPQPSRPALFSPLDREAPGKQLRDSP